MDAINKFNIQITAHNTQMPIESYNGLKPPTEGAQSERIGIPTGSIRGSSVRSIFSTSFIPNPSPPLLPGTTVSNCSTQTLASRQVNLSTGSLQSTTMDATRTFVQFRPAHASDQKSCDIQDIMNELFEYIQECMHERSEKQSVIDTCMESIRSGWNTTCQKYMQTYGQLQKMEPLFEILTTNARASTIEKLLESLYSFISKWSSMYGEMRQQTKNTRNISSELLNRISIHHQSLHAFFKGIWNAYLNTYFKLSGKPIEQSGLLPIPQGKDSAEGQLFYVYDTHLEKSEFIVTFLSASNVNNVELYKDTYFSKIWFAPVKSPNAHVRGVIFKVNPAAHLFKQTITILDQPMLLLQLKTLDLCRLEILDYNTSLQNLKAGLPSYACAVKTFLFEDLFDIGTLILHEILTPSVLQKLFKDTDEFLQDTIHKKDQKRAWISEILSNNMQPNIPYYLPMTQTREEILTDILEITETMDDLESNEHFYRFVNKLLLKDSPEDAPLKLLIEQACDGLPLENVKTSLRTDLKATYKKDLSAVPSKKIIDAVAEAEKQARALKQAAKAQKRSEKKQEKKLHSAHKHQRNVSVELHNASASADDLNKILLNQLIETEALQRIADLEADSASIKKQRHLDDKLNDLSKPLAALGISMSRIIGEGSHETLLLTGKDASLKTTAVHAHKGTASASGKLVFKQVVKNALKLLKNKAIKQLHKDN